MIELLHSENEVILGNACLCLSHCIEERSVNESLDKESMKRLLVVVREAKNAVVKQNAAILIGKLVKTNPRCVCCTLLSLYVSWNVTHISV